VRKTPAWQTTLGERILEALSDAGHGLSVGMLASNPAIFGTRAQIRERCRHLAGIGLVEYKPGPMHDAVFLTTDGVLYLSGELDARLRERRIDRSLA
jgi:hypothetical protein